MIISGKIFLILFFLGFLINFVSAACNSTQIDINSASTTELDKIDHIGLSVANYIIDYRTNNKTFDSLDELVNIKYISPNYVEDIKTEGLACISDGNSNNTNQESAQIQETSQDIPNSTEDASTQKSNPIATASVIVSDEKEPAKESLPQINLSPLSPKDIKTGINFLSPGDYAVYGLVAFCILLLALFAVKIKFPRKTEFDDE